MFRVAYDFLNTIENLNHYGFHLGTSTNLHLYFEENFILYIKIEPPLKFYLSTEYNERLKSESPKCNPNYFFHPFLEALKENGLIPEYEGKFLRIEANSEAEKYFDCCYKALAKIAEVEIEEIKNAGKFYW